MVYNVSIKLWRIGMVENQRIKWDSIKVSNDIPMDGNEITSEIFKQTNINITRQNVSNALKNAMGSFFHKLMEKDKELSAFDAAVTMLEMLYLPKGDFRGGIDSFFRLFPSDIRNIIENDARVNYMRGRNIETNEKNPRILLCKNCFNCKSGKGKGIYCSKGHFNDKTMNDIELYMPFDFNCNSFDEMY